MPTAVVGVDRDVLRSDCGSAPPSPGKAANRSYSAGSRQHSYNARPPAPVSGGRYRRASGGAGGWHAPETWRRDHRRHASVSDIADLIRAAVASLLLLSQDDSGSSLRCQVPDFNEMLPGD